MKKMLKKSKGFTLVELLIVIIIIGILAGMMMLSTGSATDKAEATKIVSDMRNVKAACLMYYADKSSWPTGSQDANVVSNYVDNSTRLSAISIVSVDTTGNSQKLRIVVDGAKWNPVWKDGSGIADKLKSMQSSSSISYDSGKVYMPVN